MATSATLSLLWPSNFFSTLDMHRLIIYCPKTASDPIGSVLFSKTPRLTKSSGTIFHRDEGATRRAKAMDGFREIRPHTPSQIPYKSAIYKNLSLSGFFVAEIYVHIKSKGSMTNETYSQNLPEQTLPQLKLFNK